MQQAEPEMHNSSDAALYDRYALFTESEKILNVVEYALSFIRARFKCEEESLTV